MLCTFKLTITTILLFMIVVSSANAVDEYGFEYNHKIEKSIAIAKTVEVIKSFEEIPEQNILKLNSNNEVDDELNNYGNSNSIYKGELSGFIALEGRVFLHDNQYPNQNQGNNLSISINPEYYYGWNNGDDGIVFSPFMRLDPSDSDRDHFDIREFNWLHVEDDWEFRLGIGKVFWGVIESNHLVDIINQTDSVENFDGEAKLGQPMLQLGMFKDWGTLRMFALPYFRERTFPGSEGRLRGIVPVDTDNAVYQSSSEETNFDVALRYEHTFGAWDIGISHFSGTSREPRLVASLNAGGQAVFIPHYDLIDQTSTDIQITTDNVLWKLEAMTRNGQGERFNAMAIGAEYNFYGINNSDIDLGLLAEYHRDDRGFGAPITVFDDDIFLGARLTFNDIDDIAILAGVMFDRNTKNRSYSIEASKRLGEHYKLELELRFFSGEGTPLEKLYSKEDFIQMRLARYF